MPEIRVDWRWNSTAPLHVGSGLSRPGVADSLVQRDHQGNPIIPGEAVKGALRMAAEQIAAWLGEAQDYGTTGNAEPTSWPLARLFGGDGTARQQDAEGGARDRALARPFGGQGAARCTPATLVAKYASQRNGSGSDRPPQNKRRHVFTSTAIDRTTGTARDNTLRKTEFVPGGRQFEARYTVRVADGETEVVETLLLAALAAVESVGGKAGIGWGRMELVEVTVADGNPAAAVASERLKALQTALSCTAPPQESAVAGDAGPEPARPTASESTEPGPAPRWFKLTIELQEPACLPGLPEFSNQVTTRDCIPATTLRGALASYWRRSGCSEADVRSWLSDATAWTPALRSIDGARTVPAPRSFVTTKRAHGKEPPVHDTFRPQAPRTKEGDPLQWRSLAGGAIRWDGSRAVVARSAARETRMHVARDYRTGSKRTGALYARESLAPGTRFVAWARVPEAAFEGGVRARDGESADRRCLELLIGKRLSAGNGRAKVQVECADGPQFFAASADDTQAGSCAVFVQLLSPAVIYDPHGYPRRTLDQSWWKFQFAGNGADAVEIRTVTSRTAPGRRGGWMGVWRHARAAVTTIDAGSVWRLCCGTPESAASLRERLRKHGRIGERTHEGFGWMVVDPPWLGKEGEKQLNAAEPEAPQPKGEAIPWPGATIDASTLADIARGLAKEEVSEDTARAYQEIAARVRIAPAEAREAGKHLEGLKKLCAERADRNKSKWKPVSELLSKPPYTDAPEEANKAEHYSVLRERLLFELGMLVTRGTAARR